MLDDLAQAGRVGQDVAPDVGLQVDRGGWRRRGTDRIEGLADHVEHVDGHDLELGRVGRPDRGEDRVDEPVEPLDLVERAAVPALADGRRSGRATRGRSSGGSSDEEVGVGPDDR